MICMFSDRGHLNLDLDLGSPEHPAYYQVSGHKHGWRARGPLEMTEPKLRVRLAGFNAT